MEALKEYGRQLKLTPDEIHTQLRLGRPATDAAWVDACDLGAEALVIAQEAMESGRYLEYSCYEANGTAQGRAVIRLKSWEDEAAGLLVADHGERSDEYYQWYMDHEVQGAAVYHVCKDKHSKCKQKLEKGDRRHLIHMDRWRLMSPATMLGATYLKALGARLGKEQLRAAAEAKDSGAKPPQGGDTGLEEALRQSAAAAEFPPGMPGASGHEGREERRDVSPPGGDRKRKRLDEHLKEQVRRSQEAERARSPRRKDRKRKGDRARKGRRDSSGGSSAERSSSASSRFHTAPARGGELWRTAQKKPGHLAQRTLDEMTRYLSSRSDMGDSEPTWSGQKVLAYLNQVVLVNHPPQRIGVRSHRELVTLAMSIDEVLGGRLKHGLDILLQRFKAIEASFEEGGWHTARHLELIPGGGSGLLREDERAAAAKAEVQAARLRDSIAKLKKNTK